MSSYLLCNNCQNNQLLCVPQKGKLAFARAGGPFTRNSWYNFSNAFLQDKKGLSRPRRIHGLAHISGTEKRLGIKNNVQIGLFMKTKQPWLCESEAAGVYMDARFCRSRVGEGQKVFIKLNCYLNPLQFGLSHIYIDSQFLTYPGF